MSKLLYPDLPPDDILNRLFISSPGDMRVSFQECISTIDALRRSTRKLATIADAYDRSELDEARPEHNPGALNKIEMVQGRGGKTLLTLQDCMDAREALKWGTDND